MRFFCVQKDGQKIILFSLCGGVLTWMIDACIDSLVFEKGSFWNALTSEDIHEQYMRSLFAVNFVFFGVLISRFVARRRKSDHARLAAEQALLESEEKLQSVMESIADSIYLIDSEYRYLYMNKKHIERLGLTGVGYVGRAYRDLHSFEESEELIENVDRVFETGETISKEHFSRRDNRYFLRTFSPVKIAGERIVAVTVVSKDVNDLKQMEEKLRTLSLADELTGLYNRRGFFTMAEPLLRLAFRKQNYVFLLYCDLDKLKEINDELGHHEGDRAIRDAAIVLKETFRETDIIARIGGDEFVVTSLAGKKEDADSAAARFKEHVRYYDELNGRPYKLSISVGMSWSNPENATSMDDLLKQAEKLMYEEKVLKQRVG